MAIPTTVSGYLTRFRQYIADTELLNLLWEAEQCSDSDLLMYMEDFIDDFNVSWPPRTYFTIDDFIDQVNWSILRMGATLEMLTNKGIGQARNQLSYSDTSGINLQDHDQYGRFLNLYHSLRPVLEKKIINWKRSYNIDSVYGDEPSEWQDLGW